MVIKRREENRKSPDSDEVSKSSATPSPHHTEGVLALPTVHGGRNSPWDHQGVNLPQNPGYAAVLCVLEQV